jgi:enoyl-CoA hydratase/carnithine racemase
VQFDTILFEVSEHIATITLNRPERLNAFNKKMATELKLAWEEIKRNEDIRCVILTGCGDKALSTGVDINGFIEDGDFQLMEEPKAKPDFLTLTAVQNGCWKPVITAINGMVCGGGLHFLADSDITVCAEHATIFDTHVKWGKVSGLEPVGLLRRVPFEHVMRLALLGGTERMSAHEAKAVGLVGDVVPKEQLMQRARELAKIIASHSPTAVARTKQTIWESMNLGLEEAHDHAWEILREHNLHLDNEEGFKASYEKRQPHWAPYIHP